MALFQKSVQNDYLNRVQDSSIKEYWEYYDSYFNNPEQQKLIEGVSERKFYSEFISKLFGKCLGYNTSLSEDQNYFIEEKNETDSGKADGAVKVNGEVVAVMEFKDTITKNLKDVESQAFGYKNTHPKCNYIVTCNFKELWFYIGDTTSKEPFNLFNLSYDSFKLLWLCLSYESISTNLPEQIKNESVTKEEKISKELYIDYSLFRNEIFNDLVDKNPQFDKLLLFKKTQKLLDRFLFIFFAEDRLLLPTNSIAKIIKKWEDDIAFGEEKSLYTTFVFYFNLLNKGRPASKEREEIFAYNGGLFAPDEMLDSIVIDDELLSKHTKKLSSYDFISDVSVNILGHIFEHSLSQIEEIQNEIAGIETDKSKSKRKKDGVFYTPAYITKYIVENTVGKLCKEKREELEFNEAEFVKDRKGRQKNTLKKLSNQLDNYREWLLGITICDPSCGSGAFLVEALNFLIDEHNYIDELRASVFGESIQFSDITASILENNLYGVDINEESVEIAKLSLWLRTAQKGRKLTSLSDNLKCGNSLIDDPEVAGDKAFNWENEFPEVFANGGFDVVIGNPPYVRQELLETSHKIYFSQAYENVYDGMADLYVYFYELSIKILKSGGVLGFITPNKWMERKYGFELRLYLKRFDIIKIVNYGELRIFEDASTEPSIITLSNTKTLEEIEYYGVKSLKEAKALLYKFERFNKDKLDDSIWKFTSLLVSDIIIKFKTDTITLKEYTKGGVYYGVKTGMNNAFIIDESKAKDLIYEDSTAEDVISKMVEGDDFKKWHLNYSGRYLISTFPSRKIDIDEYPSVKKYLVSFLPKLKQTGEEFINEVGVKEKTRKKSNNKWFETQDVIDYHQLLQKPKLIYYHTASAHNFFLDKEGYHISANCYFISNADYSLQCILNSKLFNFVKRYLFPAFGDSENGGRVRLDANKMNVLPIRKVTSTINDIFENLANKITKKSTSFEAERFLVLNYLESKYNIERPSKKLQNWYELEFSDFSKELEKARKNYAKENEAEYSKLSVSEEAEWMQYFNEQKQKAEELKTEIVKTDREIDQMVYELYGLTTEEIEIVENATK